jgi:endonuclease I
MNLLAAAGKLMVALVLAAIIATAAMGVTGSAWAPHELVMRAGENIRDAALSLMGRAPAPDTGGQIKRQMLGWPANVRRSFYCGCGINGTTQRMGSQGCLYLPAKDALTAKQVTAQEFAVLAPIIPVPTPACLTQRSCSPEQLARYQNALQDIRNLAFVEPSIAYYGQGLWHGLAEGKGAQFGRCDVAVGRYIEPSDHLKGWVGRTALYMLQTHALPIPPDRLQVYREWAVRYPPGQVEQERASYNAAARPRQR